MQIFMTSNQENYLKRLLIVLYRQNILTRIYEQFRIDFPWCKRLTQRYSSNGTLTDIRQNASDEMILSQHTICIIKSGWVSADFKQKVARSMMMLVWRTAFKYYFKMTRKCLPYGKLHLRYRMIFF